MNMCNPVISLLLNLILLCLDIMVTLTTILAFIMAFIKYLSWFFIGLDVVINAYCMLLSFKHFSNQYNCLCKCCTIIQRKFCSIPYYNMNNLNQLAPSLQVTTLTDRIPIIQQPFLKTNHHDND